MLISREDSCLLVIDVQERLAAALPERERLLTIARIALLIQAAQRLEVPVLMTEQIGKEPDPTVPALRNLVPKEAIVGKRALACTDETALAERLNTLGRKQVVLCGAETHVCVLQTAVRLQAMGRQPFVVGDAVASRLPDDHTAGLSRLRQIGVQVTTADMALFEWLRMSGTDDYDAIVALKMRSGMESTAA
jgi:nicotinamidase-related amidase